MTKDQLFEIDREMQDRLFIARFALLQKKQAELARLKTMKGPGAWRAHDALERELSQANIQGIEADAELAVGPIDF